MPTVQGTDNFNHGNFTVPGGGPYTAIFGTPTKDTTVVHGTDPASLLISTTTAAEAVEYAITGTPTRGWMGFWWRVESGAEPASDVTIANFDVTAGARAKASYQPSQDRFYWFWDGGSAQSLAASTYTPGSWIWLEFIAEVNTSTRTLNARLGGTTGTPATVTTTSTTITGATLGQDSSTPTVVMRYSNAQWGTATGATDWLGEPASGQVLLPDADVAVGGWATAPLFSKINDSSDATVISATAS